MRRLGAEYVGTLTQDDTYFRVPRGRLKLRVEDGDASLVYYLRPDERRPKVSRVLVARVLDPDAVREILAAVLGVGVRVRKVRRVYMWEGVRVHLDRVEGLGTFLEFELVTDERGVEEGRERLRRLMEVLGIGDNDLIAHSYSDLIAQGPSGGG